MSKSMLPRSLFQMSGVNKLSLPRPQQSARFEGPGRNQFSDLASTVQKDSPSLPQAGKLSWELGKSMPIPHVSLIRSGKSNSIKDFLCGTKKRAGVDDFFFKSLKETFEFSRSLLRRSKKPFSFASFADIGGTALVQPPPFDDSKKRKQNLL